MVNHLCKDGTAPDVKAEGLAVYRADGVRPGAVVEVDGHRVAATYPYHRSHDLGVKRSPGPTRTERYQALGFSQNRIAGYLLPPADSLGHAVVVGIQAAQHLFG